MLFATKKSTAACLAFALLICLSPLNASASQPSGATRKEPGTKDFSLLIPVQLHGNAPVYRLDLPIEAYKASLFSPLRDVRIFNSLGKPEPFMISTVKGAQVSAERVYPSFMQRARETDGGDIALLSEGESASKDHEGKTGRDETQRTMLGVLTDFGPDRPVFSRLRVVPESTPKIGAMVSVRIYSSENMKRWSLRDSAALGRVNMHDQALELFDLPDDVVRGRYLLILPTADTDMFDVRGILATEKTAEPAPELTFTLSGKWDEKAGGYVYRLPRSFPATSFTPVLYERNYLLRGKILTLELQSQEMRKQGAQPIQEAVWRSRSQMNSFSVTVNGDRQRSAPVPFDAAWLHPQRNDAPLRESPYTLLLKPQGNEWPGSPDLEITGKAQQIFFMANGPGPFVLAVGSEFAENKAESAFLPEMLEAAKAATLLIDEALTQKLSTAEKSSGSRWIIWGILMLGAACMGFMALQLLRKPPAAP